MKKFFAFSISIIICIAVICGVASCKKSDNTSEKETTTSSATQKPSEPLATLPVTSVPPIVTAPTYESPKVDAPNEESMYYSVTAEEREMLARLIYLESGICSLECQKAVCSVVFNRFDSGKWRKDMNNDGKITLYDIIYYPNAFSPAYKIDTTTPNERAYEAVDYVLRYGPTLPTYVRYFRASYHFSWDGYVGYCDMDNVYFGYMRNWKSGEW